MSEERTYTRRATMHIDMAKGGFSNSYILLINGRETGIEIVHRRTDRASSYEHKYFFNGEEHPTIKSAVNAYDESKKS